MLQSISSVFVVYRHKTLTGSPDPTHAKGTNNPCIIGISSVFIVYRCKTLIGSLDPTHAKGTNNPCIISGESSL